MDEPSAPFDEFGHSVESALEAPRGFLARWIRNGLRCLSFAALCVALLSAGYIILRHALPLVLGTPPTMALKSAIPLIAIGFSYLCLIMTLRRTPGQRVVGIFVSLAFMLWGLEQFVTNPAVISLIDDIVVFLFVADLSIVIRQNFQT